MNERAITNGKSNGRNGNGRNGAFTRATFVTVAVFALNVYYSITHNGELSEVGVVGLLLAGGFSVGSLFDK
jgi:hypothetical protein